MYTLDKKYSSKHTVYIKSTHNIKQHTVVNTFTYNCFVVFVGAGIDADNHAHFAFSIEVVLEQMSESRVTVRHHLDTADSKQTMTVVLRTTGVSWQQNDKPS